MAKEVNDQIQKKKGGGGATSVVQASRRRIGRWGRPDTDSNDTSRLHYRKQHFLAMLCGPNSPGGTSDTMCQN